MPTAWSEKRERQYKHIKESERRRGRTPERAQEIAARTVNKQRQLTGEAATSGRGTGNPNTDLEERTKRELYNRARELHIDGRSQMNKAELVDAIRRRHH